MSEFVIDKDIAPDTHFSSANTCRTSFRTLQIYSHGSMLDCVCLAANVQCLYFDSNVHILSIVKGLSHDICAHICCLSVARIHARRLSRPISLISAEEFHFLRDLMLEQSVKNDLPTNLLAVNQNLDVQCRDVESKH